VVCFVQRALLELLVGADVVLATTTGAALDGPLGYVFVCLFVCVCVCVYVNGVVCVCLYSRLREDHFGMTVIDECGQVRE